MSAAVAERRRGFARAMRREPTEAERALWLALRGRRFLAWKFRRQVPIGPFVADFLCFEARLVVEVDGGQHAENERDAARDRWLEANGFRVLRLWNHEVLNSKTAALDAVFAALSEVAIEGGRVRKSASRAPSSAPSGHLLPRGEKGETVAPTVSKIAKSVPRVPSLLPSREKVAAQRPDEGGRAAPSVTPAQRPDEGVRAAPSVTPAQRPDEGVRAAPSVTPAQRPDEGVRAAPSDVSGKKPNEEVNP